MLRALSQRLALVLRAVTPDPFLIAIGLSVLTFGLALALTDKGPLDCVRAWIGPRGFWNLNNFAFQMAFMLIAGHALAEARPVRRLIDRLASLPATGAGCAALTAAMSVGASMLNWGLSIVVGGLVARAVGRSAQRRGVAHHYPLLVAAGYTGMATWHGGLSGSAPIKVTLERDLVELLGPELASRIAPIPLSETLLGSTNLLVTGGLLLLVPLLCWLLAPRGAEPHEGVDRFSPPPDDEPPPPPRDTRIERIEDSPALTAVLALGLGVFLYDYVAQKGLGSLDPNVLNTVFLLAGLVLHRTPRRYLQAFGAGVGAAGGILLQFPLYGGIMGMMSGTGLVDVLAGAVGSVATPYTLPLYAFLAACVINVFIPSGGGQWAVQGPIAVAAALQLGVPVERMVMSVAYGDQLTNLMQPFWALPLLGITGVRARDIVGYTVTIMIFAGLWIGAVLLVLS